MAGEPMSPSRRRADARMDQIGRAQQLLESVTMAGREIGAAASQRWARKAGATLLGSATRRDPVGAAKMRLQPGNDPRWCAWSVARHVGRVPRPTSSARCVRTTAMVDERERARRRGAAAVGAQCSARKLGATASAPRARRPRTRSTVPPDSLARRCAEEVESQFGVKRRRRRAGALVRDVPGKVRAGASGRAAPTTISAHSARALQDRARFRSRAPACARRVMERELARAPSSGRQAAPERRMSCRSRTQRRGPQARHGRRPASMAPRLA